MYIIIGVTALVENGGLWQWIVADNLGQYYGTGKLPQIAVDCGHMTRRSHKTSSGAALLLLSFL